MLGRRPQPPHHQKPDTVSLKGKAPARSPTSIWKRRGTKRQRYAAIRDQLATACSQAQFVGDQCLVEDLENLLRRVKRRCGN